METELKVYLSEVTDDGLELSGTLDDSIYDFEDEFLKPFAGLRYELGVLLLGSELLVRGKIEQDFEAKVAANPMEDMQYILDRIVRPYIDRQLEKDTFPTKRTYRKRCKANVNN
jgi:hypothetical protein